MFAQLTALILATGIAAPVAVETDTFAGKQQTYPTSERLWNVNQNWVRGRILSQNIKSGSYQLDEMTPKGERVNRLVRHTELSPEDREYLEYFRTGVLHGKVIGVIDGDTIELLTQARDKLRIRLNGIDTPERGQDFCNKAKGRLASMISGKEVTVNVVSRDRYDRFVGFVFDSEQHNINFEMVREGFAWYYEKYFPNSPAFAEAQKAASQSKIGLWAGYKPMPPWDFRAKKASKPVIQLEREGRKIRVFASKFTPLRQKEVSETSETTRFEKRPSLFQQIVGVLVMPSSGEPKFWLNTKSNKRHNEFCHQFQRTAKGRNCFANEGEPCGICGG